MIGFPPWYVCLVELIVCLFTGREPFAPRKP